MSQQDISDVQLEVCMQELLEESDLSTTTLKSLIKQLETNLQVNLQDKKDYLLKILNDFIEKKTQDISNNDSNWNSSDDEDDRIPIRRYNTNSVNDEDIEDNADDAKTIRRNAFTKPLQLSTELSEFLGKEFASRTEVVKHIWQYIRDKELQNPKDKREILCDMMLEGIFKRKKITMFSMNKYLSKMMKNIDDLQDNKEEQEQDNDDTDNDINDEKPTKRKRSRKIHLNQLETMKNTDKSFKLLNQKRKAEESLKIKEENKKKKQKLSKQKGKGTEPSDIIKSETPSQLPKKNGFQKLMSLSPELSSFLGKDKESRAQVVSKIWAYVKENNLQNPQNKREIILDEKLKSIFKVNKVTMFSMNKYLTKHIYSDVHEDDDDDNADEDEEDNDVDS